MYNKKYAKIAYDTQDIFKNGKYLCNSRLIVLDHSLTRCIKGTKLYEKENVQFVSEAEQKIKIRKASKANIEFTKELVMKVCNRLSTINASVMLLNFSNGLCPCGDYLSGGGRREEMISRVSALPNSQSECMQAFYRKHLFDKNPYYSDALIYSPLVPVIKETEGQLLPDPYCVNMITSVAVDVPLTKKMNCFNPKKIYKTMYYRIKKILALAANKGDDTLLLGAFGCDEFQNDFYQIGEIFGRILIQENYQSLFRHIVFALHIPKSQYESFVAGFYESKA